MDKWVSFLIVFVEKTLRNNVLEIHVSCMSPLMYLKFFFFGLIFYRYWVFSSRMILSETVAFVTELVLNTFINPIIRS